MPELQLHNFKKLCTKCYEVKCFSSSTSTTVTTSMSFELPSSHVRFTSIKFTKRQSVSYWQAYPMMGLGSDNKYKIQSVISILFPKTFFSIKIPEHYFFEVKNLNLNLPTRQGAYGGLQLFGGKNLSRFVIIFLSFYPFRYYNYMIWGDQYLRVHHDRWWTSSWFSNLY